MIYFQELSDVSFYRGFYEWLTEGLKQNLARNYMQAEIIDCKHVILRRLSIDDAEDMFEFTRMKEVSEYLSWNPHKSVNEDFAFIKQAMKDLNTRYFGVVLKNEDKLIGCLHFYNINKRHRRAEISYILNPKYSGKGYASEAVSALIKKAFQEGYIRIQSLCIEGNIKSEKLMRRCGMEYEGTLKEYAILNKEDIRNMKLYSICMRE